jgi:hypothetical protein
MTEQNGFWPDGARLAVSVSMQFEAGGQPVSGASGAIEQDVWWARKDQIAQWILDHPDAAAWVDRDPAPVSGLPGRSS